jgi:hypothetical protein
VYKFKILRIARIKRFSKEYRNVKLLVAMARVIPLF